MQLFPRLPVWTAYDQTVVDGTLFSSIRNRAESSE